MTRKVLAVCAGVVLLAGTGRLLAHHAFTAAYDDTKRGGGRGRRDGVRVAQPPFVRED